MAPLPPCERASRSNVPIYGPFPCHLFTHNGTATSVCIHTPSINWLRVLTQTLRASANSPAVGGWLSEETEPTNRALNKRSMHLIRTDDKLSPRWHSVGFFSSLTKDEANFHKLYYFFDWLFLGSWLLRTVLSPPSTASQRRRMKSFSNSLGL